MNTRKNILLFLGAPGAGKGTIAQRCCAELGYEQVSTGNLCREHIACGTEIGKEMDLALKSGKLIDDTIITAMVMQWFAQNPQKSFVILDGYPRTVAQVQALHDFIVRDASIKSTVVHLAIGEQAVIDRLSMRLICSKSGCQAVYSSASGVLGNELVCKYCASELVRRPDDEPEAILKRLKLYSAHEDLLLDRYRNLGYEIVAIDASGAIDEVFAAFCARLDVRS